MRVTVSANNQPAEREAGQAFAAQAFATDGIQAMGRPSLVTRFFMRVVSAVERLNLRCAVHGNPPIYDNAIFPWAAEIESEWHLIRAELDQVLTRQSDLPGFHEISSDVATISQDRDWKTYFLSGYGFKSDRAIAACPNTWRLCNKIPGLTTVMFSILEPGSICRRTRLCPSCDHRAIGCRRRGSFAQAAIPPLSVPWPAAGTRKSRWP